MTATQSLSQWDPTSNAPAKDLYATFGCGLTRVQIRDQLQAKNVPWTEELDNNITKLEYFINDKIGQGWTNQTWQEEAKRHGYAWSNHLQYAIDRIEIRYYLPEILTLKAQDIGLSDIHRMLTGQPGARHASELQTRSEKRKLFNCGMSYGTFQKRVQQASQEVQSQEVHFSNRNYHNRDNDSIGHSGYRSNSHEPVRIDDYLPQPAYQQIEPNFMNKDSSQPHLHVDCTNLIMSNTSASAWSDRPYSGVTNGEKLEPDIYLFEDGNIPVSGTNFRPMDGMISQSLTEDIVPSSVPYVNQLTVSEANLSPTDDQYTWDSHLLEQDMFDNSYTNTSTYHDTKNIDTSAGFEYRSTGVTIGFTSVDTDHDGQICYVPRLEPESNSQMFRQTAIKRKHERQMTIGPYSSITETDKDACIRRLTEDLEVAKREANRYRNDSLEVRHVLCELLKELDRYKKSLSFHQNSLDDTTKSLDRLSLNKDHAPEKAASISRGTRPDPLEQSCSQNQMPCGDLSHTSDAKNQSFFYPDSDDDPDENTPSTQREPIRLRRFLRKPNSLRKTKSMTGISIGHKKSINPPPMPPPPKRDDTKRFTHDSTYGSERDSIIQ